MDIAQPVQKDELFWILNCFQVRQELADIQAKRALMEAVMGESKQLKEIGGYPEFVSSAVSMQFLLSILHAFAKAFFNLEHAGS